MSATTFDHDTITYWGEDAEYMAVEGHVDLAEFATAVDERIQRDDPGLGDDELPSGYDEPEHLWFRPLTREWFDRNHPCDDPDYHLQEFEEFVRCGMLEPCSAEDDGAVPWTVIATGA